MVVSARQCPHIAKKNKDYLESKSNAVAGRWKVLDWPSNSPDLNPIENLWAYLKEQLRLINPRPTNDDELFKRIQSKWAELEAEFLVQFVRDMPDRLQVLQNHGGSIPW